jgi:hypothetical protein
MESVATSEGQPLISDFASLRRVEVRGGLALLNHYIVNRNWLFFRVSALTL